MKVLIDHMNLIFISFHMARRQLKQRTGEDFNEENIGFFYHSLFNDYNKLFKTYGQLIICHEGRKSLEWRRSIYPEYKRNRDKSKQEDVYLTLKKTFPIIKQMMDNYPTKQIEVERAEADDCIFALAKHFTEKGEDVMIVSTDGDLIQVKENISPNVEVFNPIKNRLSPAKPGIILEKAIVGDASDNIPGLYRVGAKTLPKMLEDRSLWNEKMKNGNKEIFEKFKQIIDLSVYPKEVHEEIINEYESRDYNKFNPGEIELFYFENGLQDHIYRWNSDISDITEKLVEQGVEVSGFMDFAKTSETDDVEVSQTETEIDDMLSEFI